jgi:hypothetical protein
MVLPGDLNFERIGGLEKPRGCEDAQKGQEDEAAGVRGV